MSQEIKGILIPVGGNEDKGLDSDMGDAMDFISEGILFHIINKAKGTDSNIVVIPSASSIPDEVWENYKSAFGTLGCENISVLNFQSEEEANDPERCNALKTADCIMMTGGDQSKLTRIISGSLAMEIMRMRYLSEPIVIAGTSAGAVAMSKEMVTGGSSIESLVKGAIKMGEGLDFLPEVILDSHFVRRGRFGRLAEAVARMPHLLGIGLGEDTGIIIENGKDATVIGSGMIILFDPAQLTHNKHDQLSEGTPMSMSNLVVHILSNGDKFDIKEREIKILPMHESFI
ncbi:MAG: cyanophycinase [Flavobacteriales bacterium]